MKNISILFCFLLLNVNIFSQDNFNEIGKIMQTELRSYNRNVTSKIPVLKLSESRKSVILPASVDNSQNNFFPQVIAQHGFSCQQVSGVSYVYSYEMNRLRNLSSKEWKNIYPPQYTWNYMNDAEFFKGVSFFYSWDVIKRQGHPGGEAYPEIDSMGILAWMSGYDRYYASMKNRLKKVWSIPVDTEEGILTLRHYLYDHLDGSPTGGIVVFGASGGTTIDVNLFTIPVGSPEAGKKVETGFYPYATHGMTLVGYNDSIRLDLNGDGIYTNNLDITGDGVIDTRDWELGAFRMVNSYGLWWEDGGFSWIMYRAFGFKYDEGLPEWSPTSGSWNESVYTVEPVTEYSPKLTVKAGFNHSLRNMISVKAGISTDPDSQMPEHTMEFPIWNYMGNSYATNILQPGLNEMEIGLDITPLLSYAEPGKSCRLFFMIDENDIYKAGYGAVNHVSFLSYIGDTVEIPAEGTPQNIIDNGTVFFSAEFTPEFDKVKISTEEIPAFSPALPYIIQLDADGGLPPYNWKLMHPFTKNSTDSVFPLVNQQELFPQSGSVSYQPVALPFSFPFYGKVYDTVYVNAYGFITFNSDELPYHYLVDPLEMIRNNAIIAPLFSMKMSVVSPEGRMWYETGDGWAAFRWSTKINGDYSSRLNFALRIYNDGRFEFLYDNCTNQFPTASYSGYSAGDDTDNDIQINWSLSEVSGRKYLFKPDNLPASLTLSETGVLTVSNTSENVVVDLSVKVTDANNISSEKILSLTQSLDISAIIPEGASIRKNVEIPLELTLQNKGTDAVSGIVVSIIGSDGVTLIDSTENLIILTPGSSITIDDAFKFIADSSFNDKTILPFRINVVSDQISVYRDFGFLFSAADLRVTRYSVNDGVDGTVDPGEVAELQFMISNFGSSPLEDLSITLSSTDTVISILTDSTILIDLVESHDTLNLKFLVTASRFAGMGDTSRLRMTISDTSGLLLQYDFFLTAGKFPIAILSLSDDFLSTSWMNFALEQLDEKKHQYSIVPAGLGNYSVLFVNLGVIAEDSLDIPSQNILESYLMSGGKIYLEQLNHWEKPSDLYSRFNISTPSVTPYSISAANGEDGTFSQGMQFNYPTDSASFDFFPLNPAYPVFSSPESHPLQIASDNGVYRTIGSMISFGQLEDGNEPSTKKILMKKYLEFFGLDKESVRAFFHTNLTTIFEGDSILFFDDSHDSIIQWQWSFPGGEPSVSDLKDPVVRYLTGGRYDVTLTATGNSGYCSITKKNLVTVKELTGIDTNDTKSADFLIYPNPADDKIYIKAKKISSNVSYLKIINMNGGVILNQHITSDITELDVSSYTPGIYLFSIISNNRVQIVKIIIR